jgi:hypothetical protein
MSTYPADAAENRAVEVPSARLATPTPPVPTNPSRRQNP